MYAELNTKSDYCQVCGFDGEIQIVKDENTGKLIWKCPKCGNTNQDKMNVARRTCGRNILPQYKIIEIHGKSKH
jgi:anaerobic ribonucleoside-triphosphate reductase